MGLTRGLHSSFIAGIIVDTMGAYHLPHWLQATVTSSGGLGLFLVAFLDSTVLPFPSVNDLLLMDLSILVPSRMVYYASMSTLGSVVGRVLGAIARKGKEAAFHQRTGKARGRAYDTGSSATGS